MALGAVYDLGFGMAILFFAGTAAELLRLPLPADPVYLKLNGIFLVLLAALYLLPAREPRRYAGIVAVAAGGRFLGFLYLGGAWFLGWPGTFLALAAGDLFFALLHAALLGLALRAERCAAQRKS